MTNNEDSYVLSEADVTLAEKLAGDLKLKYAAQDIDFGTLAEVVFMAIEDIDEKHPVLSLEPAEADVFLNKVYELLTEQNQK